MVEKKRKRETGKEKKGLCNGNRNPGHIGETPTSGGYQLRKNPPLPGSVDWKKFLKRTQPFNVRTTEN